MKVSLVEVVWWDAHAMTDSWTRVSDLDPDPREIHSVGWLLDGVKDGHHVLAQSVDVAAEHVDGVLAIPNAMVRSIRSFA